MLKCNNLTHGGIIRDIGFSLSKGSFTAIIGKNGSGKSTLCECICGIRKHSGKVFLGDTDMAKISLLDRAKKIAFLPQILPSPSISVTELVTGGRTPYTGFAKKLSQADIEAINSSIERAGLSGFENRMLPTLSGGERQRAFLAMILAQDTDILILDEPTTFLDAAAEAEYASLLKSLTELGKTLLVSMHDLSLAARHADNILVLEKGSQIFFGKKSEAIESQVIENSFSVRKIISGDEIFFIA